MKNINIFMILMSFSVLCFGTDGDFLTTLDGKEIPDTIEVYQGGLPEAPVVSCPRPLKKYSDLLEQLSGIKTKIESEACRGSSIEVDSLEKLVSQDRETFVDLIKKGAFGDGQLTSDEVETVQTYVKNIVNKAASIAGLVKNEACFDDTDKQSTLSFLSSVISEVSGAVGALAGPFGAKISLGGKLAGTLLESVDAIVQARQTYDYGSPQKVKIESINNYMNNLCTYYDFKGDLDRERNLFMEREKLVKIFQATEKYLVEVEDKCEACSLIITDYRARVFRGGGFNLDRVTETGGKAGRDTDGVDGESLIGQELAMDPSQIAAEDLPYNQMVVYYARLFGDKIADSSAMYPPPVPAQGEEAGMAPRGSLGLGLESGTVERDYSFTPPPVYWVQPLPPYEATIRALQIQNWAKEEIIKMENDYRDSNGFDGRGAVTQLQNQIEDFLVNSEAPRYLKFRQQVLDYNINQLLDVAQEFNRRQSHTKLFIQVPMDSSFDYKIDRRDKAGQIAMAFNELWRDDIDFTSILVESGMYDSKGIGHIEGFRTSMKIRLTEALSAVVDSHGVLQRKCEFFRKSLFGQQIDQVVGSCERVERSLAMSAEIARALSWTRFGILNSFTLSLIFEERPNFKADWVESVSWALERDLRQIQSL